MTQRSPKTALLSGLSILILLAAGGFGGWYLAQSSGVPLRLTIVPSRPPAADFHLVDFDNRPRSLADFRGKILIIFFGYTHCPEACPTELFKLSQTLRRLGPDRSHVQVLLITLDPQRDTPQLLKGFVRAFDPSFIGLTGTVAQIDRVCTDYGVAHYKISSSSDYLIDHTVMTYIIDGTGHQRLLAPFDAKVEDLANDLQQLIHSS